MDGVPGPSAEVDALLHNALDLAEREEWEQLADLLREGLQEHPGNPYLLCWLGTAERELGMGGVAYERFLQVLEQAPQDPMLLATAGNAVAAFDDPAAEGALRTAALLGPDLSHTRLLYGSYLAREGMLESALHELDAALELAPDDPIVHQERGVVQALAGDLAGAEGSFGTAATLEPDDGWVLILLGLTRLERGDAEDAAGVLEQGARLRPDDVEAQLISALVLCGTQAGEEQALEMLERARMYGQGADAVLVAEVEARIEEGPEAALAFLAESIGPSAFRERLSQRP